MGQRTSYWRERSRKDREIERKMRYHAWERMPNESLKEFKKRLTGADYDPTKQSPF